MMPIRYPATCVVTYWSNLLLFQYRDRLSININTFHLSAAVYWIQLAPLLYDKLIPINYFLFLFLCINIKRASITHLMKKRRRWRHCCRLSLSRECLCCPAHCSQQGSIFLLASEMQSNQDKKKIPIERERSHRSSLSLILDLCYRIISRIKWGSFVFLCRGGNPAILV